MITGSSSGIGLAAAQQFLSAGNKVIMLCREGEKSRSARESLLETVGCSEESVDLVFADLGSRSQIQTAIQEIKSQYESIDVLVNNAAVFRTSRKVTEDGLEMNFAVNYLAMVQITAGILPLLKKAPGARVVNLSSEIYKQAKIDFDNLQSQARYKSSIAYANSKMMGLYFTLRASEALSKDGITVNAVHPGIAATEAFRDYPRIFNRLLGLFIESPAEAAGPVVHLAITQEVSDISGAYFVKYKQVESLFSNDGWSLQSDRIWKETKRLLVGFSCL